MTQNKQVSKHRSRIVYKDVVVGTNVPIKVRIKVTVIQEKKLFANILINNM